MSRTAGGAAASAGIDFQHRVAALVMAHMVTGLKDYDALGLFGESDVQELKFESQAEIDDLVLVTHSRRIFIQAKRSLSFSDALDSEFSYLLRQFVRQSLIDGNSSDAYVIATTPRASDRIVKDLRKLTDAVRFNEAGARENPMTKLEQRVLAATRTLLAHHFEAERGNRASEEWLDNVFGRIYVAPLDVETGGAHEAMAFALLAARSGIDYQTLWAFLLTLAMSLAARRLSIDRNALGQRVSHCLKQVNDPAIQTQSRILNVQLMGPLSMGREIVLVNAKEVPQIQPQEPVDYFVFELFRFNDDGSRRMEFRDGKVHLKNGPVYEVIHRAATFSGMSRFVESDTRFARHGVIGAQYNFDPDDTPAARAFREHCEQRLTAAANPLECIACGDPISDDEVPLIEIDETGHSHDIGHVHSRCRQPTHRVIGILDSALFRQQRRVRDFDYEGWFHLLQHGQEFSRALGRPNQLMPLYWVRDYNQMSRGTWCVRINLDNGDARYSAERHRVVRRSEIDAVAAAERLNTYFDEFRGKKDPICHVTLQGSEAIAPFSTAIMQGADVDACIPVTRAEPVLYTRSIARAHSTTNQYYAPLALLIERATDEPVVLNGVVHLISDPLQLDSMVANWAKGGLNLPDFVVTFLRTDDEFDKYVAKLLADGLEVVIDPVVDMSGALIRGFLVQDLRAQQSS